MVMTEMDEFLCFVINQYGDGDHPMADKDTLNFFQRDYVKRCVKRAIRGKNLTDKALELASSYL